MQVRDSKAATHDWEGTQVRVASMPFRTRPSWPADCDFYHHIEVAYPVRNCCIWEDGGGVAGRHGAGEVCFGSTGYVCHNLVVTLNVSVVWGWARE